MIKRLTPFLSVSPQIEERDFAIFAAEGFKAVVSNRPDGESEDQPPSSALAVAAKRSGLEFRHVPVVSGKVTDEDVADFAAIVSGLKGPVLAFCRTGTRSTTLWALAEAHHLAPYAIIATASAAGYDLESFRPRLEARWRTGLVAAEVGKVVPMPTPTSTNRYDVVVVGGGAARFPSPSSNQATNTTTSPAGRSSAAAASTAPRPSAPWPR